MCARQPVLADKLVAVLEVLARVEELEDAAIAVLMRCGSGEILWPRITPWAGVDAIAAAIAVDEGVAHEGYG